jgi:hypothetical protein
MTVETVDAEVIDVPYQFEEPWAKRRKRKQPRGTRVKDFPDFTQKMREKILNAARLGMPLDFCAYYNGIKPAKLKGWLERGSKAEERRETGQRLEKVEQHFAEFHREYYKATSQPVAVLLSDVFRAARTDGKIAQETLRMIAPEYFAAKTPQTAINVGVAVGLPDGKSDLHKRLSTDELLLLRKQIAEQKTLPAGEKDAEEND